MVRISVANVVQAGPPPSCAYMSDRRTSFFRVAVKELKLSYHDQVMYMYIYMCTHTTRVSSER